MFSIFLKGWGLDFPSSSQKVPIKFLLFPAISHQNPFVLTKFPNNSHQVPLVPIVTRQNPFVPIKFLSFPSSSHQNPFVFMAMEDRQVTRKVIGETLERLRQSAKQSTTVCGQAGRGATVAGV